jgi:hypothetical protein
VTNIANSFICGSSILSDKQRKHATTIVPFLVRSTEMLEMQLFSAILLTENNHGMIFGKQPLLLSVGMFSLCKAYVKGGYKNWTKWRRCAIRLGHELWSLKGGLGEPSRKRSPLAISKQAT